MNLKTKALIFIIILTACTKCYSQNFKSDLKLLMNKNYSIRIVDYHFTSDKNINNKEPIELKHKNFISRYNPFSLTAETLMLFYQYIISPQFFSSCLYERSCSNFSKDAISEFGLIKGVFMSADRLLRCNISAINDIPSEEIDIEGYAIDEPEKYHIRKK